MAKLYITTVKNALALPQNNGQNSRRLQKRLKTWKSAESLDDSLSAEVLLKYALGVEKCEVLERSDGKPFVKGAPCFSLSHSGGVVACLVSDHGEVGLDVQQLTAQAGTVVGRFGTQTEQAFCTELPSYTFVWTAKEAVFKHGGNGYSSLKQAELTDLAQDGTNYFARSKKLQIHGFLWQNYVVSYVCNEAVEVVTL